MKNYIDETILLLEGKKKKLIGYTDTGKIFIPRNQAELKPGYAKVITSEEKDTYILGTLKNKVEDYYRNIPYNEFLQVLKKFKYKLVYNKTKGGIICSAAVNEEYHILIEFFFAPANGFPVIMMYLPVDGTSNGIFNKFMISAKKEYEILNLTQFNISFNCPIKRIHQMLDRWKTLGKTYDVLNIDYINTSRTSNNLKTEITDPSFINVFGKDTINVMEDIYEEDQK